MLRVTQGPRPHLFNGTYKITYRDQRDMRYVFDIDHQIHANSPDEIYIIAKREMGHYGGIKAELIGEINEITN